MLIFNCLLIVCEFVQCAFIILFDLAQNQQINQDFVFQSYKVLKQNTSNYKKNINNKTSQLLNNKVKQRLYSTYPLNKYKQLYQKQLFKNTMHEWALKQLQEFENQMLLYGVISHKDSQSDAKYIGKDLQNYQQQQLIYKRKQLDLFDDHYNQSEINDNNYGNVEDNNDDYDNLQEDILSDQLNYISSTINNSFISTHITGFESRQNQYKEIQTKFKKIRKTDYIKKSLIKIKKNQIKKHKKNKKSDRNKTQDQYLSTTQQQKCQQECGKNAITELNIQYTQSHKEFTLQSLETNHKQIVNVFPIQHLKISQQKLIKKIQQYETKYFKQVNNQNIIEQANFTPQTTIKFIQHQHKQKYQSILASKQSLQEQLINQRIVKNKQLVNKQQQHHEIILYPNQFNQIYKSISQWINNCMNYSDNMLLHCYCKNIIIEGDNKSGKKYLFNQVLKRIGNQYNNEIISLLQIKKTFRNSQQIYSNNYDLFDFKSLFSEQNHFDEKFNSIQDISSINQLNKIILNVRIQSNIKSNQFISSFAQRSKQQSYQQRQSFEINIFLNVYCINQNETSLIFDQYFKQKYNIFKFISFTSQINQATQLSLSTQQSQGQIQLVTQFKRHIQQSIKKIQNSLNMVQQLQHQALAYILNQKKLQIKIQYKPSVIQFITKYLIKRYQQSNKTSQHPLLALKYLMNYVKNKFRKEIKNKVEANSSKNKQSQQSLLLQPKYQNQNMINLNLTTRDVIQFFTQVISSEFVSGRSNLISTFILGHQILFLACYLYLTHPLLVDSLYIDALKLYSFWVGIEEGLKIQRIQEKYYWEYLQKLKQMGMIKFRQDMQYEKKKKCQRSNTKLKLIKDYRNHQFILKISKQQIRDELEQIPVFKKFFYQQAEMR